MTPLLLIWLGTVAAFFTHTALARSYAGKGSSIEAVAAALSMAFWLVFSFGAFDVQTFAGGTANDVATGGMFLLGMSGALVMVIFLVQAATGALRDIEALDATEVRPR